MVNNVELVASKFSADKLCKGGNSTTDISEKSVMI
jgi:hypothetical protein